MSARKVMEGALYVAMLGADLVAVLFTEAYGLILGLWNFWLGVLSFTLFVSIIGVIVGPWRLRWRLALWYACIAVWFAAFTSVWGERPILNDLLVVVALIGLLGACILPVLWLSMMLRTRPDGQPDSI